MGEQKQWMTWRHEAGRWAVWFAFMVSARLTRRGWHKAVRPDKTVLPGYDVLLPRRPEEKR